MWTFLYQYDYSLKVHGTAALPRTLGEFPSTGQRGTRLSKKTPKKPLCLSQACPELSADRMVTNLLAPMRRTRTQVCQHPEYCGGGQRLSVVRQFYRSPYSLKPLPHLFLLHFIFFLNFVISAMPFYSTHLHASCMHRQSLAASLRPTATVFDERDQRPYTDRQTDDTFFGANSSAPERNDLCL